MLDDITNSSSILLHTIRILADHGNQELSHTWYQKLHIVAPILFFLQKAIEQCLENLVCLRSTGHKQRVNLESIPHQVRLLVLNNEV